MENPGKRKIDAQANERMFAVRAKHTNNVR